MLKSSEQNKESIGGSITENNSNNKEKDTENEYAHNFSLSVDF